MKIRNNKIKGLILAIFFFATIFFTACNTNNNSPENTTTNQSRLEIVLDRGKLICGVSGKLPGFSFVNQQGNYSGLDVDICRSVAAALFDDAKAIEFRQLSSPERFIALNTGEIDLLASNTTWTMSRDTEVGASFAPTIFYDGQGIMVSRNSGINRLQDLEGKTICVETGTTTLLNLEDQMRQRGINYKSLGIGDTDRLYNAYLQGRCQALTSDRSQLIGRRSNFPNPNDHLILDDVLSKEPLTPAVTDGDTKWFDVVRWSIFTLIQAEEFGITSENLENFTTTSNPAIKRFLGQEGSLGENMGLSNDFAIRIIRHVGNYGEVYDRNIGKPFNLDRNLNNLWSKGGLLYSPPFR